MALKDELRNLWELDNELTKCMSKLTPSLSLKETKREVKGGKVWQDDTGAMQIDDGGLNGIKNRSLISEENILNDNIYSSVL